ncbi:hypothetical protein ABFS83_08G227800 [Erythranthe nasuta]
MMKLSVQPQSPASDSDEIYQADDQRIAIPARFNATTDSFEKNEHSWKIMSQVPTDLSIQVQDVTFYVHKYPLISRCGYFSRVEFQFPKSNLNCDIELDNLPGGPETFETILKFCYDIPINLKVNTVAALRCASEYLEMTEALEDGNLISKTEAFFTFVVLSSWRDSITVLKSCESLSPWAENLQIVRRCCDSIAWKISQEASEVINGEKNWWFEEMSTLRIDYFTRIVTGLRAKGSKPEIIGSCIVHYGERWLPEGRGNELQWNITGGATREEDSRPIREQRIIVESLVSLLPSEKEAVSCKFLLKMLKMAILYSASPALVAELEKRTGLVLETADVNDLLIPSYTAGNKIKLISSTEENIMHNVDVVQRILEYFLLYEQQQQQQLLPGPLAVSKLLDNYLAEIAKDPNLPVTKFQFLAQSLPENARKSDDGLYRAIDTYLKTHPSLSDHDRRRLCKVMNCGKLSVDACAHAAQNDRLPLRTMIQVLFAEQMKIRATVQGKSQTEIADNSDQESSWLSTNKEVKALKLELEKVKSQMAEMQRDHSDLQQERQKQNIKQGNSSGWTIRWQRIRKSALFNLKTDGEETDEVNKRPNNIGKGSFRRRQSLS